MKNYVGPGRSMLYTASGASYSSGDLIIVNNVGVVAAVDIADGASGVVELEGVYELPAATAAINQGAIVYWDADGDPVGGTVGSGACTATSTDNTPIGFAVAAKAGAAGTVKVKLSPIGIVQVEVSGE